MAPPLMFANNEECKFPSPVNPYSSESCLNHERRDSFYAGFNPQLESTAEVVSLDDYMENCETACQNKKESGPSITDPGYMHLFDHGGEYANPYVRQPDVSSNPTKESSSTSDMNIAFREKRKLSNRYYDNTVGNPSYEQVSNCFGQIGDSVAEKENKGYCKANDFHDNADPEYMQLLTAHLRKHGNSTIRASDIACSKHMNSRTSLLDYSSIFSQEKVGSFNACDHGIPDQDYMNFINRLRGVGEAVNFINQLREVGKTDLVEPNLVRNPHKEKSVSPLEGEAVDCKKRRKPDNGYSVHADHAIPDQDYENFINQLREFGKLGIVEPNLVRKQHKEMFGYPLPGEAIDCKKKRKPDNGYDVHADHAIYDSDYTQFCNHLKEGDNYNILGLRSNIHRRVSKTATMEGAKADSIKEKDLNNIYNDHSVPDSGYLLFLNHLREDGNSYFLELVDDRNGLPMIFKYEEEEDEGEEEEEEDGEVIGGEEGEGGEGKMSKLKKQETSQNLVNKKMSVQTEKVNCDTNCNIPAAKPIPDASPVLDSYVNSGCLDVDASYQKYLDHLRLVDGDLVFDLKSAAPKSASEAPPSLTEDRNTECLVVDVAYQEFLNCLRLQDGFMILDLKSGGSIRYEEELNGTFNGTTGQQKESTCSVDHYVMPYENSNLDLDSQFKVCGNHTREQLDYDDANSFNYKEKLMEFLSRPYDPIEYEELLEEATVRKPLCRQKHLRNMSKVYATKLKGMSYLDHHPRLAKQLKEADCHRGLMLLRGFFFWLQNLCHDGSFQPWMPLQASNSPRDYIEDALSSDDDAHVVV